jgi:heptosyltransferase-2
MMTAKTLVIAPAWVGDLVMSQPLIERLAQSDPGGKVDLLAPTWTAGLCARLPGAGKCIPSPFVHGALLLGARRRLGRSLTAHGYQRAYVLPNSFKSALIPWFAGIPQRIGYRGEFRYGLLSEARLLNKQALPRMVDRYFALGLPRGAPVAAPDPRLVPDRSNGHITRLRLGLTGLEAPLILCPGAEFGPAKRWPARHFAQIARAMLPLGRPVWILGGAKDQAVAEEIRAHDAFHAINLCGRTSLAEAVDLMSLSAGVVTNDSGLMHVAAALGVPTVALFGSSSARFTPPLSARATALSLDLACSPCFRRECPLGHLDCLEKLQPAQVLAALDALQGGHVSVSTREL